MAAPPAPLVLAANGHSSSTITVALLEGEPKVPGGVAIDSLVRPLVESVIEPAQLALPGLEALEASQVEAEITSSSAAQPALVAPAQAAAAPIEIPVIALASEPAEAAGAPVEPVVVAPVTASTQVAAASEPVEPPVVASVAESTQIPVVSAPVEAPVEPVVAAPVTESTQTPVVSASVEGPVESVVAAPVTASARIPVASAPVEAPVESAVVAPVTESTRIPVASVPVEAPVEPVVAAPATESVLITVASAPVEVPVEPVVAAPVTASALTPVASTPGEAPVESVAAAPVTEPAEAAPATPVGKSTEVGSALAPAAAPGESGVAAPITEAPTAESSRATATLAPAELPTQAKPSSGAPEEKQIAAATAEAAVESAVIAPVTESAETTPAIPLVTPGESDLSAALTLQVEAVLDAIALQAEADHSGILRIRASFRKPPQTSLLTAPLKLVTAPAPPDERWRRTARPVILSRKPTEPKPALMSSGPQTSTLAGPCLPVELRTLIEDPTSAQARTRKRAGFPTWMVSVVVATFLFLGAGSLLQYVTGNRDAKAAAPTSSVASASAAGDRHPFAKFVEVTGLRVIADQNHKSQLQYIVVNHSSAQISGMAIRIAVRSAAGSSETAPLFVVSASVPSLAPYQSKEIRTGLDAELRYSAIPDWENLRADVQVNTPPE